MLVKVNGPSLADGEGNRYRSGAVVEVPDELAQRWLALGFVITAPEATDDVDGEGEDDTPTADDDADGEEPDGTAPEATDDVDGEPVAVGGGWYELPNGERVRGRENAEKALRS